MTHPVKGIDHVFLLIDDLDEGLERYRALGFTVSPRGLHSAVKGTANHTIMFPDDYVELLGILQPTPANAGRRDLLARSGEGLHAIACRIDDAEAAAAALSEIGILTQDLGSFERPVDLPDGTTGVAAFTTVAFQPSETPFGFVFMCQHRSRETVWIPELVVHANGAIGLGGVVAASSDVAARRCEFRPPVRRRPDHGRPGRRAGPHRPAVRADHAFRTRRARGALSRHRPFAHCP